MGEDVMIKKCLTVLMAMMFMASTPCAVPGLVMELDFRAPNERDMLLNWKPGNVSGFMKMCTPIVLQSEYLSSTMKLVGNPGEWGIKTVPLEYHNSVQFTVVIPADAYIYYIDSDLQTINSAPNYVRTFLPSQQLDLEQSLWTPGQSSPKSQPKSLENITEVGVPETLLMGP